MPEQPNRVEDALLAPDSNTRRFHLGSAPQAGIPSDLSEDEIASLDQHRSEIKVPGTTVPLDEDGNPVVVPTAGLVISDPETGATEPLPAKETKAGRTTPKETAPRESGPKPPEKPPAAR